MILKISLESSLPSEERERGGKALAKDTHRKISDYDPRMTAMRRFARASGRGCAETMAGPRGGGSFANVINWSGDARGGRDRD